MAKQPYVSPLGVELPDWMLEDPNDAPPPGASETAYSLQSRREIEEKIAARAKRGQQDG